MAYDSKTTLPQLDLTCGYITSEEAEKVKVWLSTQFGKYQCDNIADLVRKWIWEKYQEDKK
jgi:hypothetical protein